MSENAPRILKHTDDRHVQTRLDYMLIYKSESKAKIVRILETWMDTKYAEAYKGTADSKEQKSEPPAEDLWITMSYDQFSLFVYGTIQHDTIKQQVDELVASKHVERRIHPVYPYGPPQYRLNRELVQKSLDELEIPGNLFDLLPMFVTPRKKRTPQEKYPQGGGKKPTRDPGKIPPPTGETSHPSNNHTKNAKNPSKKEGTYSEHDHDADTGAPAPTPALVSHPEYGFLWFDDPVTPSHMVVRLTPEYPHPYHSPDEDKRRERIAGWEVEPYLKARGLNVSVVFMHDLGNETTVEASPAPHSHDSYSHSPTEGHDGDSHTHCAEPAAAHSDGSASLVDEPAEQSGRHTRGTRQAEPGARTEAGSQAKVQQEAVTDSNGYENTDEETQERPVVRVPAQQLSTFTSSSAQQRAKVEKKQGSRRGKKDEPEPITLSHDAEKIWRAWCSLFTVEVELIPSNAAAAEKLVKPARAWCSKLHWTLAEWLGSIKDNAYEADSKGYYRKRGVKLFDIPRELEGWQSAKEHELSTLAQAANPKPVEPKPIDPTLQALRQQQMRYAQGAMS